MAMPALSPNPVVENPGPAIVGNSRDYFLRGGSAWAILRLVSINLGIKINGIIANMSGRAPFAARIELA